MRIIKINKQLLAFYVGRESRDSQSLPLNSPKNWVQFDLDLGVCAYAFHHKDRALLFDTLVQPEQGREIRVYLEEKLGIKDITAALSHWHLDHVGGGAAFSDGPVLASSQTLQILSDNQTRIENGRLWGPPSLRPLILPNRVISGPTPFPLGDLDLEFIPFKLHTPGSLALFCGKYKFLLAGDMLEDNIPCLNHPEEIESYLPELQRMAAMNITTIYPGHGHPEKIASMGYSKDLIAATADYIRHVTARSREKHPAPDLLKSWLAPWENKGVLAYHSVYESVHQANLERLRALKA